MKKVHGSNYAIQGYGKRRMKYERILASKIYQHVSKKVQEAEEITMILILLSIEFKDYQILFTSSKTAYLDSGTKLLFKFIKMFINYCGFSQTNFDKICVIRNLALTELI